MKRSASQSTRAITFYVVRGLKCCEWSGIRESNPRLHLGKVAYYHYTNPANDPYRNRRIFIARAPEPRQAATIHSGTLRHYRGVLPISRPASSTAGFATVSPLPKCEPSARPENASDARRNAPHARGRCRRAQISHHHGNRPSLASDDVSGDGRGATAIAPCLPSLGPSSCFFSKVPGSLKHGTRLNSNHWLQLLQLPGARASN
jgi:hypothetical protein